MTITQTRVLFGLVALGLLISLLNAYQLVTRAAHHSAQAPVLSGATSVSNVATSTTYTVAGSSVQVFATSSHTTALAFSNINCTAAGTVFVRASFDAPATVALGMPILASSSIVVGDNDARPMTQGSMQAIASVGTCSLTVTEYRSTF